MNSFLKSATAIALAAGMTQPTFAADSINEAFKESKVFGNLRLRFENQDLGGAATPSIDLLTLRSRFGFTTGSYGGFSITAEVEDVRSALGVDGPLPFEPETTEIDQAFVQYKSETFWAKLGRQVVTQDNHRFIGHVGWRQDRQTFDALRAKWTPVKGFDIDFSYFFQRNRIFAEVADAESDDFILNGSYVTPAGKFTAYAYLLDDQLLDDASDTFGGRFDGSVGSEKTKFTYTAELATQSIDDGGADFDTNYIFAQAGVKHNTFIAKLGYEVLGSDDGAASFTTPLSTLHAHNGWADVFLGGGFAPQALPLGLEDLNLRVGGTVGGFKLLAVLHEFSSDEGSVDYGTEIGLQATKRFGTIDVGLKFASYNADEFAIDTERVWAWASYAF